MAAATASTITSKVSDWISAVRGYLFPLFEHFITQGMLIPLNDKATVATTNVDDVGDILLLSQILPAHAYVHSFRGTPTDMDTNVSPALVYDVVAIDTDGNVLQTFVSGSTNGQAAAGSDTLLAARLGAWVGSKQWRLALKVTTASATPAAGTYKWYLLLSEGTLQALYSTSGPRLANAEA